MKINLTIMLTMIFSLLAVACSRGEKTPSVIPGVPPTKSTSVSIPAALETEEATAPALITEMPGDSLNYVVVDTGQASCYDDSSTIDCPAQGEAFFGQDAQYAGVQPGYTDNGDRTISDLNTGLMWQKTPDLENKPTYIQALEGAETFNLAGYDDWRLPTIKELYSLGDFRGSSISQTAYIDTDYFDFRFGDHLAGERLIDGQYWSSTGYVGTTMRGDAAVFGVNFADGRIKGYPRDTGPDGSPATHFVRYVRGNLVYGENDFVDNADGTISDMSTGLMWMKADSGTTMDWGAALGFAESFEYAGYDDWRLPNAKELHSIVDYTRAPDALDASQRGPAIDPLFDITDNESWFWTSTTLLEAPRQLDYGAHAVYLAFGQAYGIGRNGALISVHGAGAQRSDPKSGDPADWAGGFGPQGDQIRIYNYVRLVRGPDA